MTQEEKQTLLVALCGYLPYGIKCVNTNWQKDGFVEVGKIDVDSKKIQIFEDWCDIEVCRPYLRPMDSMTEKEKEELNEYVFSKEGLRYFWFDDGIMYSGPDNQCFIGLGNDTIDRMIDWLNKHMFDYRGLIKKGLVLEAPEGMYRKEAEK